MPNRIAIKKSITKSLNGIQELYSNISLALNSPEKSGMNEDQIGRLQRSLGNIENQLKPALDILMKVSNIVSTADVHIPPDKVAIKKADAARKRALLNKRRAESPVDLPTADTEIDIDQLQKRLEDTFKKKKTKKRKTIGGEKTIGEIPGLREDINKVEQFKTIINNRSQNLKKR